MKKTIALSVLTALIISVSANGVLAANEVNVNVNPGTTVNVNVQNVNPMAESVHWEKAESADIIARGAGLAGNFTGVQGQLMARRAAIADCYRNMVARIQGVQVDGETTIENLMTTNDVVKNKISGVVKGARILEEGPLSGGGYYVVMSMPMYGQNSLASAVLPEVMSGAAAAQPPAPVTKKNTVLPKSEYKEAKAARFSGVIVDASGKGLECTMAPQIIDTNGRVVYGKDNIDINMAVAKGLVGYYSDMKTAIDTDRAGSSPLIVKAVAVRGGSNSVNPVNVVVSVEDADKILLAAGNNPMMISKAMVAFIR